MSRKIKKSLIFLCFIVLGLLFSFHFTQTTKAEGPGGLMEGAKTETTVSGKGLLQLMFAPVGNAIIALITIILQVLLLVAQISLDIAVGLLIWVTHPDFISLSYTNPAGNPLLATGWALVRNLTNMGFVISFAFIGLATALRIKEYQAQKTLLPLILMALLVNFTPVILGVIVDASNILMNFLLGEVASLQFIADMWQEQGNIVLGMLKALVGDTINYESLAATIALIIFAGTTSFIILLYILLFLFRYVAIWILVILSPLAFFSYVLPVTRKIWSQWWNQFLQWCFIGVSMAFFLYLSNHLLAAATQGKITSVLPSSEEAGGLIETLLPYGMIIALLIYGLLMSLSTSAVGAKYAIKATKGIGAAALGAGAVAGKRVVETVTERIASSERTQQIAQRMATYTPEGRFAQVTVAPISRAIGRTLGPGLIEAERRRIDEAEKKIADQKVEAQMAAYVRAKTDKERIGMLIAMTKDKNIDDAMDVERFGNAAIPRAEIGRLYSIAQERDKHSVLRAAFPELARTHLPAGAAPPPPPSGISQAQHEAQYVFNQIKPADYENMSRQVIGDPSRGIPGDNEFLEAVIRRGTDRHIQRFIDRFQQEGAIAFEQRLQALAAAQGISSRQLLRSINPRLFRYFTRGPGQGLVQI